MQFTRKWLRDNGLSVVFFLLFVVALIAQSISGFLGYSSTLTAMHQPPISFPEYLLTGDFLEGVFSNWQAALLQLGCLILFGAKLKQKGASHSLKPEPTSGKEKRRGGKRVSWIYRNSLSLAFAVLFTLSFLAHLVFGTRAYNETRSLQGQMPVSVAAFLCDGTFWAKTFQTWQAEFVAIGIFLVLSIFLRQEGSAESKPVESSDDETGEVNH
jgi:hypothetical protein